MNFDAFLETAIKLESIGLPGQEAQFKMSPPFREQLIEKQRDKINAAKKAAVLALFYPDSDNQTNLMLILRKTYRGVHSAQIGFPGGKLEANESAKEAAIRETHEEVGVDPKYTQVLKELTEVYIPPSNFFVQPFLGISKTTPNFIKQDNEVEALVEVKLQHILDETNVVSRSVSTAYGVKVEVPAYQLNNHSVWGATAMMLSEVKDLLNSALEL